MADSVKGPESRFADKRDRMIQKSAESGCYTGCNSSFLIIRYSFALSLKRKAKAKKRIRAENKRVRRRITS